MSASDFVRGHPATEILMKAPPEQVFSMAMHQAATLHTLVSMELCRHPELIPTKPAEFAVLLSFRATRGLLGP